MPQIGIEPRVGAPFNPRFVVQVPDLQGNLPLLRIGLFVVTRFTKNWKEFQSAKGRLEEDDEIAFVLEEISTSGYDEVALAKAFEEAEGNPDKAKSVYIRNRIRRLKDMATYGSTILRQISIDAVSEERKNLEDELKALKSSGKTAGKLLVLSLVALFFSVFLAPEFAIFCLIITILIFAFGFITETGNSKRIKMIEKELSGDKINSKIINHLINATIVIGLIFIYYVTK